MAANQGAANTLNSPRRFSHGASPGCEAKYCCTATGSEPCCGSTEPGTEPSASRKSSTSAVRMEVSCRHAQRGQLAEGSAAAPLPVTSGSVSFVPNGLVASVSAEAD